MERILRDPQAKVGPGGRLLHVDPVPAAEPAPAAALAPEAAPFPYADTFRLHSRPGSKRVIFLDFDGETITGTAWNGYLGTTVVDAVAFNRDLSPEFSEPEQNEIQSIWQKVAEDCAIFDVDVTTEDPGEPAITRSCESDELFGTRALITNTNIGCGCGGVAYLRAFNDPASCTVAPPVGTWAVTARYSGDTQFLPATSSSLTQVVSLASTTVVVTPSTNPIRVGAPLTLAAVVTAAGSAPTGQAGTVTCARWSCGGRPASRTTPRPWC